MWLLFLVAPTPWPCCRVWWRCLSRWNWDLNIGHVNHGLRGTESEEDADFVEKLGNHFGVPVSIREARLKKQDAKFAKTVAPSLCARGSVSSP